MPAPVRTGSYHELIGRFAPGNDSCFQFHARGGAGWGSVFCATYIIDWGDTDDLVMQFCCYAPHGEQG